MNQKKVSWLLSLTVIASLFLSLPASACGCGMLLTSSDDGWSYGDDSVENSFINFENGAVGILTDNVVDRTEYYTEAIVLALIPFKNKKLYNL